MAPGLDDFLQQQLGERPTKAPRRRKAVKPGVTGQYRAYEQRFDDWACRNFDKWLTRLEDCGRHVYAWWLKY